MNKLQNRLLVTKTVRLKKEELNVRYAELGDPAKPTVLLLHGVSWLRIQLDTPNVVF